MKNTDRQSITPLYTYEMAYEYIFCRECMPGSKYCLTLKEFRHIDSGEVDLFLKVYFYLIFFLNNLPK